MTFSYDNWDSLLAATVSEDGKMDYELLMAERATLDSFVDELNQISPDSRPDLFVTDDEALAYWINAYNAFTLHSIAQEYPIRSVWKTREGQFFNKRRHVAGGERISLDDIEHNILRGDFAEPRIHFAINCGSNGCPAMRPAAYRGEDIGETLSRATETFLGSEWDCRGDESQKKIYVSRIFKMYAEDFAGGAGGAGTRDEYREGVLRFVAQHTGLAFEAISDHELVYNTYDWGLNDTHREPNIGPITFHEPVEHFSPSDPQLRELHLYEGNFCNRACSWCTIHGSPEGWYKPYTKAILDQALSTLASDGNLKFYGGEPTLHTDQIIEAIAYVRERGFQGLVTVFSNGIQAEKLIRILSSDDRTECVLNYSIFHGRDAQEIPPHARARLEQWSIDNPHRVFKGYKVLFHAGAGTDARFDQDREAEYHGMGEGCVRCFPVLTTKGRFHACPFAAEIDSPHFDLGKVGSDPAQVYDNYKTFMRWVDETLDPAAKEKGCSSCEMCHQHLSELQAPSFES